MQAGTRSLDDILQEIARQLQITILSNLRQQPYQGKVPRLLEQMNCTEQECRYVGRYCGIYGAGEKGEKTNAQQMTDESERF